MANDGFVAWTREQEEHLLLSTLEASPRYDDSIGWPLTVSAAWVPWGKENESSFSMCIHYGQLKNGPNASSRSGSRSR